VLSAHRFGQLPSNPSRLQIDESMVFVFRIMSRGSLPDVIKRLFPKTDRYQIEGRRKFRFPETCKSVTKRYQSCLVHLYTVLESHMRPWTCSYWRDVDVQICIIVKPQLSIYPMWVATVSTWGSIGIARIRAFQNNRIGRECPLLGWNRADSGRFCQHVGKQA
jgi:hypothetical protein